VIFILLFHKKKSYICLVKLKKQNLDMRTLKNLLLLAMFSIMANTAFGQGIVKGTVMEADTDMPLPGANIIVVGTDKGTTADFDGNFVLEIPAGKQTIKIAYLGYDNKIIVIEIPEGQTKNLGKISLKPDAESLNEIVIVGVADIAKDRQTPVAVSTMKAAEIEERIGTKELPEVLNYTPSVYATKQGGGFGDARINVRGFDQRNTAVMINGMPVNDMENGWVYWSNWAGLADVTSAMQVQRGLGSSKLAISSVGGTINILTNSADKKKGGAIAATFGNDNYMKFSAAYNTGLLENGLSASVLLSRFSGDGYVDATEGEGYTWFLSLGYKVNDKHNLMFTATGAPQWHHQRSYAPTIDNYITYGGENGEPNIRYNADWGWYNGEVYSLRRNFYHKPIASLNWEWNINDASKLSTVLYGSWGRGGGTGDIGRIGGKKIYYTNSNGEPYFKNEEGLYLFDEIAAWNSGQAPFDNNGLTVPVRTPDGDGKFTNDRNNGITRRASMNSHDWYGIIMNYHNNFTDKLSFDVGIDGRTYSGYHYRVVNDVLGADRYLDNRNVNDPNNYIYPEDFVEATPSWNPFIDIKGQEKIEYFNQGNVRWLGGFGQVEYKTEKYSAFVQGGISNQQFQRIDYFNYLDSDPEQASDWVSLNGGNIKGGMNYNINENHNVFVNAGYYSKQPLFRAVFPNYNNNDTNKDLKNETVIGMEAGYGFKNEHWRVNLNLYNTSWKDRFAQVSAFLDTDNDGNGDTFGSARLYGIEEVHKGVELESSAKYGPVKISGMVSMGDWKYKKNVTAPFVDDNNDPIPGQEKTLYLEGVKVGDAAQFTARYGINYNPVKGLYLDVNQFFADNLYANFDPVSMGSPNNKGALKLPAYSLVDASITYKFGIEKVGKVTTRFSVNNLFDKKYISESDTNYFAGPNDSTWHGINTRNRVFFGWGRSWNFSVKLRF
jgi:outer membrane cobalamin receptor